jgi:hypothetical protein
MNRQRVGPKAACRLQSHEPRNVPHRGRGFSEMVPKAKLRTLLGNTV